MSRHGGRTLVVLALALLGTAVGAWLVRRSGGPIAGDRPATEGIEPAGSSSLAAPSRMNRAAIDPNEPMKKDVGSPATPASGVAKHVERIRVVEGGRAVVGASVRARARDGASPLEIVKITDADGYATFEGIDESANPQFDLVAVADGNGAYQLDGLSVEGAYDVKAIGSGRATAAPVEPVRVSAGEPTLRVDLTLRRSAMVTIRLVLPGATREPEKVRLVCERGALEPTAETPDGRYVFNEIDPDVYLAFANVAGLLPIARRVDVGEGDHIDVDLTLQRGVDVEGIVVDLAGAPMPRMNVLIATPESNTARQDPRLTCGVPVESDAQGRFAFRSVRPGEFLIAANSRTVASAYETREPLRFSAPTRALRVVVEPVGGVRARLLTPAGAPFVGRVATSPNNSGLGGSADVTDGAISFRLGLDGEFNIVLGPDGYAWLTRPVHVVHGEWVDPVTSRSNPVSRAPAR